jgi:serine/threonine protein kinase
MAPEMIKSENYTEKADVYSFGVCLWELYCRKVPYRELKMSSSALVVKVAKERLRPRVPDGMPEQWRTLLEQCWGSRPERRPSFAKILQVLATMKNDKKFLDHNPFNSKQNIVRDVTEETSQRKSMAENSWKIRSRAEVQIMEKLSGKDPISYNKTKGENRVRQSTPNSQALRTPPSNFSESYSLISGCDIPILKGIYKGNDVAVSVHNTGEEGASELTEEVWQLVQKRWDVRHPNLCLFMGCFVDGGEVSILAEFMDHGNLLQVLHDESLGISWDTMVEFLIDAASGLTCLHKQKQPIIHEVHTKKSCSFFFLFSFPDGL